MKCPECGSEVAPDEKFCGNCGAPIEGLDTSSEVASEEPAGETVAASVPITPPLPEPEDMPALEAPEVEAVPPPLPAASADSGSRKTVWIIVAIAAAVIVLCCCCGALGLAILNSEEFQDAVNDLAMIAPQILAVI
jgi:hypothetical protein